MMCFKPQFCCVLVLGVTDQFGGLVGCCVRFGVWCNVTNVHLLHLHLQRHWPVNSAGLHYFT